MSKAKKQVYIPYMSVNRINRIMNKGWKLVAIEKKGRYIFEKCNPNQYICMMRFLNPETDNLEEYHQIEREIEEYRQQGADIITDLHIDEKELEELQENGTLGIEIPKDGIDSYYYIIIPKRELTEQETYLSDIPHLLMIKGYCCVYGHVAFTCLLGLMACLFEFCNEGKLNWFEWIVLVTCAIALPQFLYWYFLFFKYRLYRKEYSIKAKKKKR